MKMTITFAAILALAITILTPAWSADRYVDPDGGHVTPFTNDWASAATNIQAAVDVSTDGDTIWIAKGEYTADTNSVEVSQFDETNVVTISERQVALRGVTGNPADVIINGEGAYRGIGYVRTASSSSIPFTLDSLTISNCFTAGNGTAAWLNWTRITTSRVINCVVVDNVGNTTFYTYNISSTYPASLVVSNSVFRGNQANAGVLHTRLMGVNSMHNIRIQDNIGSGLYLHGGSESVMANSIIQGNSQSFDAGGIYVRDIVLNVFNTLVCNNYSDDQGGGIFLKSGTPNLRLYNSTIVSNRSKNAAAGIQQIDGAIAAYNSIVYDNRRNNGDLENFGGSDIAFTNCCFSPTNDYPDAGNIDADPLFVDVPGRNYRLTAGSPCINAGLYQGWMAGALDLDGNPRVDALSRTVDIGCYEYVYTGTTILIQ